MGFNLQLCKCEKLVKDCSYCNSLPVAHGYEIVNRKELANAPITAFDRD